MRYIPVLLLLVFLLVLPLPSQAEEAAVRIACILPSYPDFIFWQQINSSIEAAAKELNAELTMLYTRNSDPSLVLSLDNALSIATLSDVDAIITSYTLATDATNGLLLAAREAGIRVVMIDCDAPSALRDVYIGIDNLNAGMMMGQASRQALKPGQAALLIYADMSLRHKNLNDRITGIQQAFADMPDALICCSLDVLGTPESTLKLTAFLQSEPRVAAVLTINENSTLFCAPILSRIDPQGNLLRIGFDVSDDTLSLLQNGNLDLLIGQPNEEMGRASVKAAVDLVRGQTPSCDTCLIDCITLPVGGSPSPAPSDLVKGGGS